nr:M56 family metallopeptidase [Marinicella sp. NBU2979]
MWWSLIWLAGLIGLVYRHRHSQRQWCWLMQSRQAVTNPDTLTAFHRLLVHSGLPANTRLSQSEVLTSPIALHREVVCPTAFLQQCRAEQIEAALAHELAHIKRRDGLWLAINQWWQMVLFFQPLNRLLTQHIHQATEQQADALATTWTNNPKALAVTLVDVAKAQQPRQLNQQPQPLMVPAMTSKKSQLLQRVENIMQPQNKRTSRLWTMGLMGILALIVVTAPGVVAQTHSVLTNIHHASGSSYHHISTDGGETEISISSSRDDRQLKVKAKLKGDIQFNDDESQILAFPSNSRFDLTHSEGGIKQRILIESAPGTNAENAAYTYWYEGDEQAFDAAARRWFASVIPMVYRETGLQAEARVERIQSHHGDQGVLEEVALIHSDFVRKAYLKHLFSLSVLSDRDLSQAMTLAADIGSDFELAHVLSAMVATQEIESEGQWLDFFAATGSIGSDFEMAKTMLNVLPQLPPSTAINQAYFTAAESIGSDFEMAKVLIAYLDQRGDQGVNVQNLFALATAIGSDFELAKVMLAANQHIEQADEALFTAYLDLASHIGSDFEMKKVYADLLKFNVPEAHLARMIEAAAEHIGSDFELANLLLSISRQPAMNDAIKARIKAAANSIGSNFERNRVLAAIS